jgi:hypothetical protein
MKLITEQKNHIQEQYDALKQTDKEFEEIHDMIVEHCVDEYIVDLSYDEDGDLYEEFSNEVWDFLESIK